MASPDLTIEENLRWAEHHRESGNAGLMLFHLNLARKQAGAGRGFTEVQKSRVELLWNAAHPLAMKELTGDFFSAGIYYDVGKVAGAMVRLAYLAATSGLTPLMVSNLDQLSREPDYSFTEPIMPAVPGMPTAGTAPANIERETIAGLLGHAHEHATRGQVEAVNDLLAEASASAERAGYAFSPEEQEHMGMVKTVAAAASIISRANSGVSHRDFPEPWLFFGPCMRFVHSGLLSFTEVVDAYAAAALNHASNAAPDNGHASKARDYLIFLTVASLDGVDLQPWVAQLESDFAELVHEYINDLAATHTRAIETAVAKAEQGLAGVDALSSLVDEPLTTPVRLRTYIDAIRAVQRADPTHIRVLNKTGAPRFRATQ